MSDFNSSLPVKTLAAGDVSVKFDQTTPGTTNNVAISAGSTALAAGTGTAAASLRVNLATDVALPTGTNSIGKISDITTSVTPGTGQTNLGKAEDLASADGDVGVGMLAVRKAAPANTSGTDGDYEFLQMSGGYLWVGGALDNSTWTQGSTRTFPMGMVFDDTSPVAATEDKLTVPRGSSRRELYVQIRDAAGNERGLNVDANNRIGVNAFVGDATNANKVQSYTSAVVTAGTTTTSAFQYATNTGKTFLLREILVSASGRVKAELQIGPVASLVSKAVFFNSTASPNIIASFNQAFEIPDTSTGTSRVLITNNESSDMSVYVTFIGVEV